MNQTSSYRTKIFVLLCLNITFPIDGCKKHHKEYKEQLINVEQYPEVTEEEYPPVIEIVDEGVPFCVKNHTAFHIFTLFFFIIFAISAWLGKVGVFGIEGINDINYKLGFNTSYEMQYLCFMKNATFETRNITIPIGIDNGISLYSSDDYASSYNMLSTLLGFMIGLLYVLISFLSSYYINNRNKIAIVIRLFSQTFLWLLMFYMTIVSIVWLFTDLKVDNTVITAKKSFISPFNVTVNTNNSSFNGLFDLHLPDGLSYNIPNDDGLIFPTGYSKALPIIFHLLKNVIAVNLTEFFPMTNIELINHELKDLDCDNTVVENITLNTVNYNSNMPTDMTSITNTIHLLIIDGLSLIIGFLFSIWTYFNNFLQMKYVLQN